MFQLDGGLLYGRGCIQFHDTKGNGWVNCDDPCMLIEGIVPPIGTDLRGELESGTTDQVQP